MWNCFWMWCGDMACQFTAAFLLCRRLPVEARSGWMWLSLVDGEPRMASSTRLISEMLLLRRSFHMRGTSRSRMSLGESRGDGGGLRRRLGNGDDGC